VRHAAGLEHFPVHDISFHRLARLGGGTTPEKYFQLSTTGILDGTVIFDAQWPKVTLGNLQNVITELKRKAFNS